MLVKIIHVHVSLVFYVEPSKMARNRMCFRRLLSLSLFLSESPFFLDRNGLVHAPIDPARHAEISLLPSFGMNLRAVVVMPRSLGKRDAAAKRDHIGVIDMKNEAFLDRGEEATTNPKWKFRDAPTNFSHISELLAPMRFFSPFFSLSLSCKEAKAIIEGPREKYMKVGSTLRLYCGFHNLTEQPEIIFW